MALGPIIVGVLLILFFLTKNERGIIVIFIFSLIGDLFQIPLTFKIPYAHLIGLLYLPKTIQFYVKKDIAPTLKYINYEFIYLVILGLLLGFLFPWKGDFDYLREWTQKAQGKTIISLFRFLSEIGIVLVTSYWLRKQKISLAQLIQIISITITIQVILAIIDGLTGYHIRSTLFGFARIIDNRFLGFNYEPRAFGQTCSFVLLGLVVLYDKKRWTRYGIIASVIGVVLSLSASTYVMTILWLIIYLFYLKKFKTLVIIGGITIVAVTFSVASPVFRTTFDKIGIVLGSNATESEKISQTEPLILTRFEIFDRAALNFLIRNPLYIVTGTGPNLVTIPSSPYITNTDYLIYGNNLNSPPHMFLVNLIARSGLIGLFLWLSFFVKTYKRGKLQNKSVNTLLICSFAAFFIVFSPLMYLYIGILNYLLNDYYDKHSHASFERSRFYRKKYISY